MPVPDPFTGQLGVLRPDDRGQLRVEHLTHHHQPRRGREREQPFSHRRGDIADRHGCLQRQARQLSGDVRVVSFTTGTFFDTVIPLPVQVSWRTPNHANNGKARGGITTSLQQNPGQPHDHPSTTEAPQLRAPSRYRTAWVSSLSLALRPLVLDASCSGPARNRTMEKSSSEPATRGERRSRNRVAGRPAPAAHHIVCEPTTGNWPRVGTFVPIRWSATRRPHRRPSLRRCSTRVAARRRPPVRRRCTAVTLATAQRSTAMATVWPAVDREARSDGPFCSEPRTVCRHAGYWQIRLRSRCWNNAQPPRLSGADRGRRERQLLRMLVSSRRTAVHRSRSSPHDGIVIPIAERELAIGES